MIATASVHVSMVTNRVFLEHPMSLGQHPVARACNNRSTGLCVIFQEGTISKKVCAQMTEVFSKIYSDKEALAWMLDAAEGLSYLHTLPLPVVHRVSAFTHTV